MSLLGVLLFLPGGTGAYFGGAVSELKMGYCYAMNRLGFVPEDPRQLTLREAVIEATKAQLG